MAKAAFRQFFEMFVSAVTNNLWSIFAAVICNCTVLISLNRSTFCYLSQQVLFHLVRSYSVLIPSVSIISFVIGLGN